MDHRLGLGGCRALSQRLEGFVDRAQGAGYNVNVVALKNAAWNI
jgi:hypothetical protein